jgi:hypothetical protein
MKEFTKAELVEKGFCPGVKRARLSLPFCLPLGCSSEVYRRLPAELKSKYTLEEGATIAKLVY